MLVIADVGLREMFGQGITWAQKVAVYLMIWAGFIGGGITNHKGGHLRPELADKLWGEKGANVFHFLRHFITGLFCVIAAYYSVIYIIESYELGDRSPIVDVSLWVVQIVIPLSFILMSVQSISFAFIKDLRPSNTRAGH